jgi:hypothetical protein
MAGVPVVIYAFAFFCAFVAFLAKRIHKAKVKA